MKTALTDFLLHMGDNTLVLGHRVSEWCGHAPILEEDIALANTALDLIGQTQMWLGLAAERQGNDKTADDIAFLRDVWQFRNFLLLELPNGDFGQTMMRQFLFDTWHVAMLNALQNSTDTGISAIAQKALKEAQYHVDRSADTVIGLGDGTAQSHAKMQAALDYLWPYVAEMFKADDQDKPLIDEGLIPDPACLRAEFDARLSQVLGLATLKTPLSTYAQSGGKTARQHTEHLGHILCQMQWLQRAYPGANW